MQGEIGIWYRTTQGLVLGLFSIFGMYRKDLGSEFLSLFICICTSFSNFDFTFVRTM